MSEEVGKTFLVWSAFSLNFSLTIAVMVRGHSSDILLVPHWT